MNKLKGMIGILGLSATLLLFFFSRAPAGGKNEKEPSPRLRLQAVSQLLHERNWGEAMRLFREIRNLAVASKDDVLSCQVWQKLWDFYFLERQEKVSFSAGNLKLAGKFYDVPGWTAGQTIILSHGSSVWGQNHPFVVMMALEMARRGYRVFTFDYRGFGASQDPANLDSPTALDFPNDLTAAIALVKKRRDDNSGPIILLGHSFGAGPTLASGFAHPDIASLVIIGPARRVRQRNLDAGASSGIEELRKRLKNDMELDRLPAFNAVKEITARLLIDNFAGKTFSQPLLIVDGEQEKPELRQFLAAIVASMKGPVTYHSLPGARHYFGLDVFRDYFNGMRSRNVEIGMKNIARTCSQLCNGKVDMALFFNFIDDIDSWLKKNPACPKK